MKLTTTTNVSVDGVMQGLGGPDEDRRGGFERRGRGMRVNFSITRVVIAGERSASPPATVRTAPTLERALAPGY